MQRTYSSKKINAEWVNVYDEKNDKLINLIGGKPKNGKRLNLKKFCLNPLIL